MRSWFFVFPAVFLVVYGPRPSLENPRVPL